MTERTNSLRERYSALSDDELQNVAIKQQALQRKEKSIHLYSRIGYGISLFGILAGLFALYVQKDREKRRRHDHRKRHLVSFGVGYCHAAAACMAFPA